MTIPANSPATLDAGRWRDAIFRPDDADPSRTPPPEKVFVREPPLAKLGELIELKGDIPAFVAVVCGKPREWADRLADDSLYELFDLGCTLNDPRFDRWLARQTKTVETMTAQTRKITALSNSQPTPPSPSASNPPASGAA